MYAQRKALRTAAATLLVAALGHLGALAGTGPGTAHADLLLFSPDWNAGNFGVLSTAVRAHLSEVGPPIGFKVFARYEDFRLELDTGRPTFLSAPAWVESEAPRLELRPLARPLLAGAASYRKVLLVGPGISRGTDLANRSIAVVSHGGGDRLLASVLEELELEVDSVRIIPVPKDVDALLALGFGQVDAALVTSGQLARLAAVNPSAAEKLSRIATTAEIPYPLLYATRRAGSELTESMVRSIESMPQTRGGKKALGLLGYDRYEILAARDASVEVSEP